MQEVIYKLPNEPHRKVALDTRIRSFAAILMACLGLLLTATAAAQSTADSETPPWDIGSNSSINFANWSCPFGGAPITGYDLLLLLGIAIALAILAVLLYRLTLEDLIRRGIRPAMLSGTIANLALGTWLLVAFVLISDVIGLCWFIIIGAVFLLWLIALMVLRRILLGMAIAFILLAVAIVVILQLVF